MLQTEKGDAIFVKMDIFKKHLWYTYKEERFKWFRLDLEQVLEIVDINKNGEKAASLEEYESDTEEIPKVSFEDSAGQDSLTRFDAPKKSKHRRNRNKKKTKAKANKSGASASKKQTRNSKKPNTPKAENQQKRNRPNRNNKKRKSRPKNGNNAPNKK